MLKLQRQHFIHLHSSFAIKMQPSSINPCPDWIYLSRSQGDKIDVERPATKQNSWHRRCIVFAILLNCPLNQQVNDPSKKQPLLVMFGSFSCRLRWNLIRQQIYFETAFLDHTTPPAWILADSPDALHCPGEITRTMLGACFGFICFNSFCLGTDPIRAEIFTK